MITFDEMEIEGFCSIQKLTFNFNRRGLNLVKAPNGSGKTTLFSAFSWVLYGQTLKKKNEVNTWPKYQPKNYKGTKVVLKFKKDETEYKVIRCNNYKGKVRGSKGKDRLILIENGEERKDLRTKPITQAAIGDLLGYSHDLFINSVIFGQKLKRIIQDSGPNKKKIFEDAFEVTYLNVAKKKAAEQKEITDEKLNDVKPKLLSTAQKVKQLLERENAALKAKKKFKSQKKAEIDIIKSKLKVQKAKVADPNQLKLTIKYFHDLAQGCRDELKDSKEIEINKFKSEMTLSQLEGSVTDAKRMIVKLKEQFPSGNAKCPRCGQTLSKAKQRRERNEIKQDISDYEKIRDQAIKSVNAVKKELKAYNEQIASFEEVKSNLTKYETKYNKLEGNLIMQETALKQIKQYKIQIKAIKRRKFTINLKKLAKKVKEAEEELTPLNKLYEELVKEATVLNWLIKVPLSNSGIKAFIFDFMLRLVNEQLENYEKHIGFKINFSVDLNSAKRDFVTSITRRDTNQNYDDLSGGEQQLVDIALAFAIHDVTSIEKNVNVLFLDEVFESLDAVNVEIVEQLIKQKSQDKAVWLVTHLDTFNPSGSNIVRLTSIKGRTKLVE